MATESTEHTENKNMEKEYSSTIWPILYFEADWPSNIPSFELGVQLIRADQKTLNDIAGINRDGYGGNPQGLDNIRNYTQWFIAMRQPRVDERIPVNEKGISFAENLQWSIVKSFLLCLQLVRSTKAICTFKFPAEIHDGLIEDVDTREDPYGINADEPDVYPPTENFKEGDLQTLSFLWSSIIKLRKLDIGNVLVSDARFFRDCDIKAGEDATKRMVDILISNPAYLEISEEERKRFASSLSETELWKEYYKESFQKVFLEKQEQAFSGRTRLGRALNLFFEGLYLPLQHAFLSMCLVLETLFTIDEGETTHKITTRLAKIIGPRGNKGKEKRKELYKRAKKVYEERSGIVHGAKLIDTENDDVLKDAFFFARRGLQCILLYPILMSLYSDPGTTDKKLKGKKKDIAKNAIRDYFLDLDLQCDKE